MSAKKTGSVTALRQASGVGRPSASRVTIPVATGLLASGALTSMRSSFAILTGVSANSASEPEGAGAVVCS